ncbi:MAG: helix-turn-helix transcriptional regulator, partial [Solirubrobacteraceae bacterium]
MHDRVCLVIAVRDGRGATFEAAGMSVLEVGGLTAPASTELLAARSGVAVDREVGVELHRATNGNPLALLELARRLSAEQLASTGALPRPLPSGPGVERAFGPLLTALTDEAQEALVVAAADDSGDLRTVAGALRERGLPVGALAAAEEQRIVSIAGGRIEFAHPVLRSAAYHRASGAARRAAHAAVAA